MPRTRLVRRLLAETAPLILLSAPSGAGKTTLLSQWLEADSRPSAWLHLDRGDNDPVTLLHFLALALGGVAPVAPAVHAWLSLQAPPVTEAVMPALMVAAAGAQPFVLVLDDVQCVHDDRSWAAVRQLLAALPVGATIALCGRADPALPLARLRAEGELAEYRLDDLCFDRAEIAELLRLRGLAAGSGLVDRVLESTEGWAAGSYLAAAAMARAHEPDALLAPAMAGRDIDDYIAGEVLAELPYEVADFLARTSVVERLSPDLCNALTGRRDGLAMLRRIERENLFIVALDSGHGWYRYHRLFASALRAELGRRDPAALPDLHRRAASWFQEQDRVRDAVHHWLAAGDLSAAGDLVAERWLSRYDRGRLLTARLWLDEFQPGQELSHPPLTVAAAWLRALTGDAAAATRLLGRLDPDALDAASPDGAASLRSSAAILAAALGCGGWQGTRTNARLALTLEREHGRVGLWLDFASHVAGVAEALAGESAEAVRLLEAAAWRGPGVRSSIELAALGHLSLLAGDEGRWREAETYAAEAAAKAAVYELEDYIPSIPARVARDRLAARAWDDDALADMRELLDSLSVQVVSPWIAAQIALVLAAAMMDRGDARAARLRLAEARLRLERWSAPALERRARDLDARLGRMVLPEPVSAAEMRVLELLPTCLTVGEIAARLSVSPNTVGTHVRSLHRKLGASSRSTTVARAVDLGLLAPPRDLAAT